MVYFIGKEFFPKLSEIIFTSYCWTIYFLIVLYLGYRRYRELKDFSNHFDFIYSEEQSYAKMEQLAIWAETLTEIQKTKLDLLKYFSPIPLLIFILGVYVNNNSSINNNINMFSIELQCGDVLMYLGIGVPIFYYSFLYSTFQSYRKSARKMMDYKGQSVILKDKGLN
jgi:hypothetical protein